MSMLRSLGRAAVVAGSIGAIAAGAHEAVNARRLRVPGPARGQVFESVSILVPMRDEADCIADCIKALLAQEHLHDVEVLVLDDASSDNSAAIVQRHFDEAPESSTIRTRLIASTEDPPDGWLGKTWACQRLSREATGDVLVFIDADVRLEQDAVARAIDLMRWAQLDAVCPYPRQETVTVAERVVQPLLQWSILTFLPLRAAETSPRPSLAAGNGQFFVVDAAAYQACAGHESVRDDPLEDIGLIRSLKRNGSRGVVVDGTALATCRMYEGWDDLRAGYTKSLWWAFGSPAGAVATIGALGLMYVVPPAAALLTGSRVGAFGYAAAVASRAHTASRTGGRAWPDSLAHPASVVVLAWLTAASWRARQARTVSWKGRSVSWGSEGVRSSRQ